MWRLIGLTIFVSLWSTVNANELYVEKSLKTSSAARFYGQDKLTSQQNDLGIVIEYDKNDFSAKFDGAWQYDLAYDIHNKYGQASKEKYHQRLWLDQAYVSQLFGDWELSLGYQKIAWGKADDLRIVDIINPLDLKDFVLFDINEYKISRPMLRAETTTSNNWDLEFLWLYDFKPNQLAPIDSEFYFATGPNVKTDKVSGTEFGISISGFEFETDIAFYIFNGYNDNPVFEISQQGGKLVHHRETMIGTSFSRPFGGIVLRSEIALFFKRVFGLIDATSVASTQIQSLVGIDYLYSDWLFTSQITDRFINDWNSNYVSPEREAFYTLSADANLLSGTLTTRFAMSYAGSFGGGTLYQSKFTYRLSETWKFQINIDYFSGQANNFFGNFKNKDRIWLSSTYTF